MIRSNVGIDSAQAALIQKKHEFVTRDMAKNHHSASQALASWHENHRSEEEAFGPAFGLPPPAEHLPKSGGQACRARKRHVSQDDVDYIEDCGLDYVGAR
jgi:hypothetical protein|uniref:Uncharacterized protein n=1 Tax=Tetraselmis chuii TaxID=63592 RepID=A0A7S1SN98_9CHLO|mmetsp:Transcript_16839/g.30017  ORF Transcript_16839/g.30017 Transcript_16839/m.30017 type:complete len:100 (+) Transcript_16839:362-661(+)|eukprot:CAMPEP_0177776418 /NCGR_PEP_ID=MMETSP0491_2-20121128/14699_1 /TAXON_ID=63592 /ORGANISM="Tetraselmis chuii, Strain PLY429" /LENGTH=99 /DNA_ID=CAMNT_0019295201 /DNA_START=360 /DNA_END=659 /DNA_ORIENTATION=-